MQEMAAHVGDVTVMTCQGGCDVTAVADPFFVRDDDLDSRLCCFIPATSALGGSPIRATSSPSPLAATKNADNPRSTPTQPVWSARLRATCC